MKFQYVDIGTSDFSTSIGLLKPGEMGLYVEPIFQYLANLPNGPGVIKAPFAVSDTVGWGRIHYVTEENIFKFQVPDWVRGCNSLNRPHQLLSSVLDTSIPVEEIWVPTITFLDLLNLYSIESIHTLNIDTEGHDHIILKQVIDHVDALGIKILKFEYVMYNDNLQELEQIIDRLCSMNFTSVRSGDDVTLHRSDT